MSLTYDFPKTWVDHGPMNSVREYATECRGSFNLPADPRGWRQYAISLIDREEIHHISVYRQKGYLFEMAMRRTHKVYPCGLGTDSPYWLTVDL